MGACHSSSKKSVTSKNSTCPNLLEKLTSEEFFIQTKENTYKKDWSYEMPKFMNFGNNPMFLEELFVIKLSLTTNNTFSIKINSKFGSKVCKCTQENCFDFLNIDLSGNYEILNREAENETLKLTCLNKTYDFYHMHGDKREDEIQNAEIETSVFLLQVSKREEYRGEKGYLFRLKLEQ